MPTAFHFHLRRPNAAPSRPRCLAVAALIAAFPLLLQAQSTDAPGHVLIADNKAKDANGIQFSYFDAPRSVSDTGVVVFKSSYTGPAYAQGFWQGSGGLAKALAARGMAAPGGGLYQDVVSYTGDQMMTAAGYATFEANVRMPPSTTDVDGLYLVTPQGISYRVAYEGQSAPGGGTFKSFQFSSSWSMSPNGKIVFYAITTGGAGGGYYYARLVGSTPVVTAIALHGDPAPGTDGTFKLAGSGVGNIHMAVSDAGFATFTCATTNTTGSAIYQWDGTTITKVPNSSGASVLDMLFATNSSGTVAFTPSDAYLRVGNSAGTQIIFKYNDPAPGGGNFGSGLWGKPVINEAGQVAFTAYGKGIFLWSGGTLKAVALSGQSAPGGGTMSDLSNAEPILTNTGYVIFKAGTSGGDRIFMSDGNEMVAAVSVGDQVAGEYIGTLSMGSYYHGAPLFANEGAANNAGQICYLADLDPTPSSGRDRTAVLRFTPPARWWTGGSGDWDTATHWKFSFIPSAQRDVIIDPSATAIVTGPATSLTVSSLQIGGGGGTTRLDLVKGTMVATTKGTTVTPNGVLGGTGMIGGDLFMDGTQEILGSGAAQSLGTASYTNRSHTSFRLTANQATVGTISAQSLQVIDGAQVDVVLNSAGSTVDMTGAFWDARQSWQLFNASSLTGTFVLGQVTADSLGDPVDSSRGSFSLASTATTVDLLWTPYQAVPTVSAPADQLVTLGSHVGFDTSGTGGLLFYRWFRDNNIVSTSTSSGFSIASATLNDAGSYTVSATNDAGQATSTPATRLAVVDPVVVSQSMIKGATLSLTVHAEGPGLSFHWYQGSNALTNGANGSGGTVSGATTSTLMVTKVTQEEAGTYACVVSLGALSLRTLDATASVMDPPTVSAPADQLVAQGTRVDLTSTVVGATSQQWKKNGVNIPSALGTTLTLASAALTDAASYSLSAANAAGTTTSTPVTRVGVVNRALPSFSVIKGGTIALSVAAAAPAGTVFSYQWYRGATALSNGGLGAVTTGALTSKLTITKATKNEQGDYTCRISMGGLSLDTAAATITEINPPAITTTVVPAATVSAPFQWQLTADENATAFTVSGLPSGLAATSAGQIKGTPNLSGSFKLMVSARNTAGTGAQQPFTLVIGALPTGTAGTFSGLIGRDASLNDNLGGWFTVTVAASGTYTGTLKNGSASYSLAGRLLAPVSGDATAAVSVKRTPPPATLTLNLTFEAANNGVSGSLTDGSVTALAEGRRHLWAGKAAAAYAAAYNSALPLPTGSENDLAQPLGDGWQQMTVTSAGAVTGTGRTADGVSYTFGGSLWPDASLPQFVLLYTSHGSITGLPQITAGATIPDNRVAGWVEQIKTGPASTSDRTYKTGIPLLRRDVDGAPWIKPTTAAPIVLGLPDAVGNAHLAFNQGGVESAAQFGSLAQRFRINKNNTTTFLGKTLGNPCGAAMSITSSSGLFSGTFTLTDTVAAKPVARKVTYAGILLSHRASGHGYFLLPGLVPGTTTSPILGGQAELTP